jgi:hypothetical protein
MRPVTVIASYDPKQPHQRLQVHGADRDLIETILVVGADRAGIKPQAGCTSIEGDLRSGETLNCILTRITTRYLLLLPGKGQAFFGPDMLGALLGGAKTFEAAIVYSDFYDESVLGKVLHPLNYYQLGSVRDGFDFGGALLFSVSAIGDALGKYGPIADVLYAGLYDLRLKVSIDHSLHHLPEALYSVIRTDELSGEESLFAYVDPRNADAQKEMETVFTNFLRNMGAYLPPYGLRKAVHSPESFPVEASVIIPVRNRRGTIADAVKSALSQETDFPFNVIVVDNHSTDGTTPLLSGLARQNPSVEHIIPARSDLAIGGCWNEALCSRACGRYAVQLDSDDLYSNTRSLGRIVDMLRQGNYAMVIGSYTLVNERLEEIPPGLVDHREWTDENGHNNALRVNGLGAPRAFNTAVMREMGFLNVSYGEDYDAVLRICREYRIGRIYESLYLCRRRSGNTDADLTLVETNRNDAFKDSIRSAELLARRDLNQET